MNASLYRIVGGVLSPAESLSLDDCDPDAEKMVRRSMASIARGEAGAGFKAEDGGTAAIGIRLTKGRGEPMRYFCIGEELIRPSTIGFVVPGGGEDDALRTHLDWLLDLCLSVSEAMSIVPVEGRQPIRAMADRLWKGRPCLVHAEVHSAMSAESARLIARLAKTMEILWYLDAVV